MHCLMQLQFHGPKDHNYIYEVSVLVSVRRTVMAKYSPGHKWLILLHMYSKNVYELLPGMNLAYDCFKTVLMQCYNIQIMPKAFILGWIYALSSL